MEKKGNTKRWLARGNGLSFLYVNFCVFQWMRPLNWWSDETIQLLKENKGKNDREWFFRSQRFFFLENGKIKGCEDRRQWEYRAEGMRFSVTASNAKIFHMWNNGIEGRKIEGKETSVNSTSYIQAMEFVSAIYILTYSSRFECSSRRDGSTEWKKYENGAVSKMEDKVQESQIGKYFE